ncbi:MAG: hypothetical protein RBR91_07660, partial [Porticoccaceae bacterium]|nr:hypothetical protein [Porticoccaceae bacterium]
PPYHGTRRAEERSVIGREKRARRPSGNKQRGDDQSRHDGETKDENHSNACQCLPVFADHLSNLR